MASKIVVGYDGSEAAERALDFAMSRADLSGNSLVIAHVLEWSPYSFLTPSEVEERHRRRTEEMQRAETAILAPLTARIRAAGIEVETLIRYGHTAETMCRIATEQDAAMIVIGRTGHSGFAARLFGSVAGTLAQVAPVPVVIVP
ncbi:universal stress protein [Paracoccus tibetensis]|jgi:nucleotide-binding universal stress UspA family protein|uniref:Nucleotide-binding universal stress protein, UspA family n=1 Tax=Paracoccus tibetensis TaxID=336292 RepID=A0A1G5JAR9_9RHOB|nr:universal stress protein [Paracoccus tibetensis]SCY85040.1 Nucleotide-binding universal stress protein, UspA family [Paracoccus tibetensis]